MKSWKDKRIHNPVKRKRSKLPSYHHLLKNIKSKYNMTSDEYVAMMDKQKGCCAICKETLIKCTGKVSPLIDHCHATGKVRAMLCSKCNTGLGSFDHDTIKMYNALLYLRNN